MGWDITTIGKHRLDVRNVKTLARQLSEKLDINIKYGYFTEYCLLEDKQTVRWSDEIEWISLGEIIHSPEKPTYRLTDVRYSEREIFAKCSAMGIRPVMEDKNDRFRIEESDVLFQLEAWEEEEYSKMELYYLDIYKEVFHASFYNDPGRWFSFYRFFKDVETLHEEYDALCAFRRPRRWLAEKVGCEYIYMFSDQGTSDIIGLGQFPTWSMLEAYIKSLKWIDDYYDVVTKNGYAYDREDKREADRLAFRLIDIPAFLTAKDPVPSKYANDIFRDDFSDLD